MKLCRVQTTTGIRPAICDDSGDAHDLSGVVDDINCNTLDPTVLDRIRGVALDDLPVIAGSHEPPLADFGRIFCIGLNYYDHAEEMGLDIPTQPILFMKACAVTGPDAPLILPRGGDQTDWEVELGVVIGRRAKYVSEAAALEHVAGYCVANDLSERAFQFDHGGQWVKGKSFDGFAPVGPYLVTTDDVPDPQALDLTLDLNGTRMQNGSTRRMIFSVAQIIAHLSQYLTLLPGDLIMTGTPPGVGNAQTPKRFLQPGDHMVASIAGLGQISQTVHAAD